MSLEPITEQELREQYKQGKRDFRNLKMHNVALNDTNLSGADFSGCNIFGCTFFGSKFVGCKFIGAEIKWNDFNFTDFTNADFTNARLEWMSFDNAKVKGAVFKGAHLERISFYSTPINSTDLTNTTMIKCFRSESEITVADLDLMISEMKRHGFPTDAITNIERVREKTKRTQKIREGEDETLKYAKETKEDQYSSSSKGEYAKGDKGIGTYKKKNSVGSYKK